MQKNSGARLLADRYWLGEMIASGGMAEVYRAVDLHLERPVAIKMPYLQPDADPSFQERLGQEARLTSTLDHPNIVRVYDYGSTGDRPFLVMELVEGQSLATLLGSTGTLPVEQALRVAREVLAALDHAHTRGIVHGDVKPQNVLMAGDERAKLADFGIAETISASAPFGQKTVLGTEHYLAPERLEGKPASVASDLYSTGVLLYRILTGRLPTGGDSLRTTPSQTALVEPPPPSSVQPALPAWLDDFVSRAMSRNPGDRYPSAASMLSALEMGASLHDAKTEELPIQSPARTAPEPTAHAEARLEPVHRGARLPLYAAAAVLVLAVAAAGLWLGSAILGPLGGAAAATSPQPSSGRQLATPVASPTTMPATATPRPTPTQTAVPQSPTRTPSLMERLRQMESQLRRDMAGVTAKERQKLVKELEDAMEKAGEGDRKQAAEKLEDMRESVRKLEEDRKLNSGLADRLVAQITAMVELLR